MIRRPLFSIANQLRYGLVLGVVLSLLLTGGALTYLSFKTQLKQAILLQEERSRSAANEISSSLNEIKRQLNYLAELRGLTNFSPTVQNSILEGLIKSNSSYDVVGLMNQSGQIVTALSPYKVLLPSEFNLWGKSEDYSDLFFVTFSKGETYISPVKIDPLTHIPFTVMAVPIRNQDNQIDGVLFAKINLAFLTRILTDINVGERGYAYVFDNRFILIAQKNQKSQGNELEKLSDNPFIKTIFELARSPNKSPAIVYKGLKGEEVLGAATLVRRMQWTVVVELATAEVYAPVYRMILLMIVALILAILVAIIIGFLFAKTIISPLEKLTKAAAQVSKGHLNIQANINAKNELGILAHTFNRMSTQLGELYQSLEEQVAARTLQLAQANQEISELNNKLKAENLRMSTELDITRRLQKMILPKDSEILAIKELDIAGFMEPAEEVGGDYYDVLTHKGQVKIAIGDVTGHGLESGVLMMMAQTAVRSLLENDETDPKKLLTAVNRTLYKNVERMKSEKNMTLCLLDYQDKKLLVSGQHEDIILVKNGGCFEVIPTIKLGFPLALEKDISDWIDSTEIPLNSGDLVVLYTDGITEAENHDRKLYGLERLCEIVQQNWQLSALAIQEAVIKDVKRHIGSHIVYDDITLVVIKQK